MMEVSANELMHKFFRKHAHERPCRTAVQGEPCYNAVHWARTEGMRLHPDWYESMGLRQDSAFEAFQFELRKRFHADCRRLVATRGLRQTSTFEAFVSAGGEET